jgi:hypothetical protein
MVDDLMKRLTWFAGSLFAALSFSCVTPLEIPEDCQNGVDDNEDGAEDCADEQCVGTPECTEVCNNGLDEDQDGAADCADNDCDGALNCILNSNEICNNGTDDDNDGKIDCLDESCATAANCVQNLTEDCDNNDDDDNDGLTDCQDQDCFGAPNCEQTFTENCNNGGDEDLDGQIDCQDSDCVNAANCVQNPAELCSGGADEDGDGQVDCNDSDCAANPICNAPSCNPAPNDSCTNNDICIVDECQNAFGRTYRITNIFTSLDSTNAASEDWDSLSNPDIEVEIIFNDVSILTTPEVTPGLVNGRYTVDHGTSQGVNVTINSGDKLEVRVVDDDFPDAADLAISCVADPLSAQLLRFRDIGCVTADNITAEVFFSLIPQ